MSIDELSRTTTIPVSRLRSLESGSARWRADELNEVAWNLDFDVGQFLQRVIRHLEKRKPAREEESGRAHVMAGAVQNEALDAETLRLQQEAKRQQQEARRREQYERRRRRDRTRRLVQHACELPDDEWQEALSISLATRAATDAELRLAILDATQLLNEQGLNRPD